MTTIISLIIVIVFLAILGKVFIKDSSGSSGKKKKAPDPGNTSPVSEDVEDKNPESSNKNLKTAEINIKGSNLFHPPSEPAFFTGRKETQTKIMARTTTRPIIIGISGHPGVGKTCLAISLINKYSP